MVYCAAIDIQHTENITLDKMNLSEKKRNGYFGGHIRWEWENNIKLVLDENLMVTLRNKSATTFGPKLHNTVVK